MQMVLTRHTRPNNLDATPDVLFWLSLLGYVGYILLSRWNPDIRYARYVFPILVLILATARRTLSPAGVRLFDPVLRPFGFLFLIIALTSGVRMVLSGVYYSRYFEEVLFMGAPLVAASTLLTFRRTTESKAYFTIFLVLVADYILEVGVAPIASALAGPTVFAADVLDSVSPTESLRAFSFGLFAIYFLGRRRYLQFLLAVAFALLAGKRIVAIALFSALVAAAAGRPDTGRKKAAIVFAAASVNLVIALALLNLDQWGISNWIADMTGRSADAIMMGRGHLFALVGDRVGEVPVWGIGLGRISDILKNESAWLTNPHSDVLKHFIEFGPALFVVWIGVLFWQTSSRSSLALAVFLNSLFLTDNVSIYFDVMFLFYLVFSSLQSPSACMAPVSATHGLAPLRLPLSSREGRELVDVHP